MFMKTTHRILKRKLDYAEYDFIHTSKQSKNPILIFNYCKHGNLETSSKVFLYPDKRNLCLKCAEELSMLDVSINRNDYTHVIELLGDRVKHRIGKEDLFLWYPLLYGTINKKLGDTWQQKTYMFINDIQDVPRCSCGNIKKFDGCLNDFKEKCESCARSEAVTLSTQKRSVDMWTNIFKNDFNIKDPQFIVKDLYHIELFLNNEKIVMKKAIIHQLRKRGILSYELIDESNFDIDYYLNEYKNNFETYKMLSEKSLKKINPFVYKMIEIKNREYKIDDFCELKYFIKKGYKSKPKCSLCNEYAVFNHSRKKYSPNCEKHKYQVFCSSPENEIYTYIKKIYSGKIERTYRLYGTGELDVFLPELNIGFEYNGLYWHSEKIKPNDYHYKKCKKFKEKGIKMITIWEDDWNYKNDIIKSIIKNALNLIENKIYARECFVNVINRNDATLFLEKNHIQGKCISSINLGLFYKEELVSVMTFGKKRMILGVKTSEKNEYELLRFCNKLNTSVIGGLAKLFNYFVKNYKPSSVISYVNLDLFDGSSYKFIGFKQSPNITLNYWWAKEKRYHRSRFMKHKLIKEGADPNKTESEIMRERYYNKVWGCGNAKWIYNSC